jgi:hypothetical protein
VSDSARVGVDVVAGLIPGQPMPEYTRRWFITSDEWTVAGRTPDGQSELLATVNGKAQGYAGLLMLQPDRLNWVQVQWVWF